MDEILVKLEDLLKRVSTEDTDLFVDSVLEGLTPERRRLLKLCAIPHEFDPLILQVLAPTLNADAAAQTYLDFSAIPFVRYSLDILRLEDNVRHRLFNEWLRPRFQPEFAAASERLFQYFDDLSNDGENDEEATRLKRMFHLLGFDLREGFLEFERLFRLRRREFNLTKCEQLIKLASEYEPVLPTAYRNRLAYQSGKLAADRHKLDNAEAIFKDLLSRDLDNELRIKAYNRLGRVYASNGNWLDARTQYLQAVKLVECVAGAEKRLSLLNHDLALTYLETGEIDEAETLLKQSVSQAETDGNLSLVAAGLNSLGTLFRKIRDYETAREYYRESLAYLLKTGDKFRIAQLYNNLAITYLDNREWQASKEYLNNSIEIKREVGDLIGEAKTLNNLTRVYQNTGDYVSALATVRMAINNFELVHDFRNLAYAQWNLGKLCKRAGQTSESLEALENAAKLFERRRLYSEARNVREEITT